MSRLGESAKKTMTLSTLMNGREKISTEEIIRTIDGIVTISAIDIISTTKFDAKTQSMVTNTFPVLTYLEDSEKFFFGGAAMNNIVQDWIALCGSIEDVNNELAQTGGVKVKLEVKRVSNGNQFTNVTVLD